MSDPSYDFFATGRPIAPPSDVVGTPGGPTHSPPSNPSWAYNPGAVNQFGTPLDVAPAPTGPFAAPGVAAGPIGSPGMVSTWAGPAPHGRATHAATTSPAGLPRNVRAVAVLALFFGALLGLATMWGLLQYSALSTAVRTASTSAESDVVVAAALTAVLVALVILAATTLFLLVGGVATLANRRWGGWMLVAAFGLSLLGQVRQLAETGLDTIALVTVGITLALFLALVTGEGRQWLLRR
jgi:hypothetical protein